MERAATVTLRVPAMLRASCDGARELELAAVSVRAALAHLERSYPAFHRSICDETGAVRRHVAVYVNYSHVRERDGIDTALAPGDVVTVFPAVSGG